MSPFCPRGLRGLQEQLDNGDSLLKAKAALMGVTNAAMDVTA